MRASGPPASFAQWNEPGALLVVEDDAALRATIGDALSGLCRRVHLAGTLAEATQLCRREPPDLVVLDLELPDGDGATLLHRLRAQTTAPLIVLSGVADTERRIELLDAGADDFVAKPCSTAELLARVRGQLRRAATTGAARKAVSIRYGSVEIDAGAGRVTRDGVVQRLTPTEWALLNTLLDHAGRTLSPRQLWDLVWQREFGDHALHVRVQITRLRRKVEPEPHMPRLIVTVPGVGYRFVLP